MTARVSRFQVALLLAATAPLAAQTGLPIHFGARVRIRPVESGLGGPEIPDQLRRHRFFGTFVRSSGDTVIVFPSKGGPEVALRAGWLERLDVSRGRHSHTGRGALIGFLTGAVGGAILGAVACADCGHGDTLIDPTPGEAAAIVGFAGGLAGLGLGAGIGALIRTERWRRVPLDAARFSLAPAPGGGVRAGVSLALGAIRP